MSISADSLRSYLQTNENHGRILVVTEMGGHSSDHDAISELAEAYNLTVIADCAHALGTRFDGRSVASFALASCYSFSTLKNISTLGEGGAIATNCSQIAERVAKLKECWPVGEYSTDQSIFADKLSTLSPAELANVARFMRPGSTLRERSAVLTAVGTNFKLSAVQCAVGIKQLSKLPSLNEKRRQIALAYTELLRSTPYDPILPRKNSESTWHLFNAQRRTPNLQKILKILERLSRDTDFDHVNRYWPACDLAAVRDVAKYDVTCYANYSSLFFGRLLSLPINPKMTEEDVQWIVNVILEIEDA